MASPSLVLLADQFMEFGGPIFGKHVTEWRLRTDGIQVRTNVKTPQALVKISAAGQPRPYRIDDDFSNGQVFTNRRITAYQSKQDWTFDPEVFRNTVLANADGVPFYDLALNQTAKEYLDKVQLNTVYGGSRNESGTTPADICNGWKKIIDGMIAGTDEFGDTIIPVATGAITAANAVAAVETMKSNAPAWMRQSLTPVIVYCSFDVFDKYAANYRALNGFKFEPRITGDYPVDNSNIILRPVVWLGTSQRLIMTVENNLVFGTDNEQVTIAATPYLNYLKCRQLFPAGCQIQDAEALFVNDQA